MGSDGSFRLVRIRVFSSVPRVGGKWNGFSYTLFTMSARDSIADMFLWRALDLRCCPVYFVMGEQSGGVMLNLVIA